jgi:hypothetical protein
MVIWKLNLRFPDLNHNGSEAKRVEGGKINKKKKK